MNPTPDICRGKIWPYAGNSENLVLLSMMGVKMHQVRTISRKGIKRFLLFVLIITAVILLWIVGGIIIQIVRPYLDPEYCRALPEACYPGKGLY